MDGKKEIVIDGVKYLRTDAVARHLGIGTSTVTHWSQAKKIGKPRKVGQWNYYRKDELGPPRPLQQTKKARRDERRALRAARMRKAYEKQKQLSLPLPQTQGIRLEDIDAKLGAIWARLDNIQKLVENLMPNAVRPALRPVEDYKRKSKKRKKKEAPTYRNKLRSSLESFLEGKELELATNVYDHLFQQTHLDGAKSSMVVMILEELGWERADYKIDRKWVFQKIKGGKHAHEEARS